MSVELMSPRTAPPSGNEGLDLLRAQAALYERLERLAVRQRSFIDHEDAGMLLRLLADRQTLSQTLLDVATQLEPIRREWRPFRRRLTPSQQEEADALLAETEGRLRRVIEGDEHDARLLAARKESIAVNLRTAVCKSRALDAYRTPVEAGNRLDHWEDCAT